MTISPFAVPPLLAALLNFGLMVWVYAEAPKGIIRRTFLMWTLWIGLWNLMIGGGYLFSDIHQAYLWYKVLSACVVMFLTPLFLHFVMAVTGSLQKSRHRKYLYIAYATAIVFGVLVAATPLIMTEGLTRYYWGYYPIAGKIEWLFSGTFLIMVGYSFSILYRAVKQTRGAESNQMKYLLAGAIACFGGGATNFLPLYGFSVYPIGNLMNSLYALLVAYAILEHGLFDLSIAARRGTVYVILSGSLTAVYLSLVAVLQHVFGRYGIEEHVAFYTAAFPITVVLAPSMKARIEPFVDQTFFSQTAAERKAVFKNRDMVVMGILASEMSHELTKPLTHIMNAGSRLENAVDKNQRKNLRTITQEVQRVSEILDGFAMLSPERTLHRIAVPLEDLIEEAVSTLNLAEDKELRIERRYEKLPNLSVNPGQLVQVFTNVIQNAWQAMPEGGELHISLSGVLTGGILSGVEVTVLDTGRGIPRDLQAKVFEPFFTTKEGRGGRGMGLTISLAMVERHGGTISIQSPVTLSGGTRMTICLPITSQEDSHET